MWTTLRIRPIGVDIQMTLVTPADASGPVPVMIMFGGGTLAQALGAPPPGGRGGFRHRQAAIRRPLSN